jgi:hypothetical protein
MSWRAGYVLVGVVLVQVTQLRSNGFRGSVVENLNARSGGSSAAALSLVIELRSSAAAKRQQGDQLRTAISTQGSGTVIKRFTVAGAPGAEGFTGTDAGQSGAAIVVFAEGSCCCCSATSIRKATRPRQ